MNLKDNKATSGIWHVGNKAALEVTWDVDSDSIKTMGDLLDVELVKIYPFDDDDDEGDEDE